MNRSVSELSKIMNVELTKVGEGQRQVMNFTEQLRDLQDIFEKSQTEGYFGQNIIWKLCSKMFWHRLNIKCNTHFKMAK